MQEQCLSVGKLIQRFTRFLDVTGAHAALRSQLTRVNPFCLITGKTIASCDGLHAVIWGRLRLKISHLLGHQSYHRFVNEASYPVVVCGLQKLKRTELLRAPATTAGLQNLSMVLSGSLQSGSLAWWTLGSARLLQVG